MTELGSTPTNNESVQKNEGSSGSPEAVTQEAGSNLVQQSTNEPVSNDPKIQPDEPTPTTDLSPSDPKDLPDVDLFNVEDGIVENVEKPKDGCCGHCVHLIKSTKGLQLAFLAAIFMSLTSYLVSVLVTERQYDASHTVIARYAPTTLFTIIHLLYLELVKKNHVFGVVWPLTSKKKGCDFFKLMLRGIFGGTIFICQSYALQFIHSADCSVIMYSNSIFVTITAHFVLKEPLGCFTLVLGVVTMMGVIIVAKPPFLTGGPPYDHNLLIGIILAVLAMIFTTAAVVTIRKLKYMHYSVLTISYAVSGLVGGLIVMGATGKFTAPRPEGFNVTPLDIVLLSLIGILNFLGIYCNTLAYIYEQAGPVSIVRSFEVVAIFLWQMISHIYPDAYSLGGACIVLTCIVLTGFRQFLLSLPMEHKCRTLFYAPLNIFF